MAMAAALPAVEGAATGGAATTGATAAESTAAESTATKSGVTPAKKAAPKKPTKKTAALDKGNKTAKKADKAYWSGWNVSSGSKGYNANYTKKYRRILAAEYIIGMIIIFSEFFSGNAYRNALKSDNSLAGKANMVDESMVNWTKQMVAYSIVFAVLSGTTVFSVKLAKFSTYIGGLALLTLIIQKRDRIPYIFSSFMSMGFTTSSIGSTTGGGDWLGNSAPGTVAPGTVAPGAGGNTTKDPGGLSA